MSGQSEVTRLLMRIAATRLDQNVSAEDFCNQLEQLVDLCYETAVKESVGTDDLPPGVEAPSSRIRLAESTAAQETKSPPSPAGRGRLSHDDKVRIRRRYDEAMQGRQRAPPGWLEGMAVEYNCSVGLIKQIVYRKDGT